MLRREYRTHPGQKDPIPLRNTAIWSRAALLLRVCISACTEISSFMTPVVMLDSEILDSNCCELFSAST